MERTIEPKAESSRRSLRWDLALLVGIVLLPAIVVGACVSKERFVAANIGQAALRAPEEARAAQQVELHRQVNETESAAQELERRVAMLATTAHRARGRVDGEVGRTDEGARALRRELHRFVDEIKTLRAPRDGRDQAPGSP